MGQSKDAIDACCEIHDGSYQECGKKSKADPCRTALEKYLCLKEADCELADCIVDAIMDIDNEDGTSRIGVGGPLFAPPALLYFTIRCKLI